jgi:hypothetical protein
MGGGFRLAPGVVALGSGLAAAGIVTALRAAITGAFVARFSA